MSDLTGYSVSSVSRLLDQMGRMGLVQRYKDPTLGRFVYRIPIDYHNLTISGLEAWIRQSEESIEEIKNLRRKVDVFKSQRGEEADINHLHAMLKSIEEKSQSVLNIIKKDIKELKRPQT